MPLLEDWFHLVAICLGAICLDEPAKMNMAKTAEYRIDIVGVSLYWAQGTDHEAPWSTLVTQLR